MEVIQSTTIVPERTTKSYIIFETEIETLRFIFYSDIVVEFLSIILMIGSFIVWYTNPLAIIIMIVLGVLGLVFGGFGVYLSLFQGRIWKRIRNQ